MKPNLAHFDNHESLPHVAERLEKIVIRMKGKIKKSDLATELNNLLNEIKSKDKDIIIDHGTFSVKYNGKTCYLGNSLPFRLFERLYKTPGIFIHYDNLKQDVWGNEDVNDEALQRQASILPL